MREGQIIQEKHREQEERIHVAFPVVIESFLEEESDVGADGARTRGILKMRAIVSPKRRKLLFNGEVVVLPKIFEVPVAWYQFHKFMIRPPLAKGDVVMVLMSDEALDELIKDRKLHVPDRNRIHAVEDAVILGLPVRMDSDPYTPREALDALCLYVMKGSNQGASSGKGMTGKPVAKLILTPDGNLKMVFKKIDIKCNEFKLGAGIIETSSETFWAKVGKKFKVGEGKNAVALCPDGCSSILFTDPPSKGGAGYSPGLTEPLFYEVPPSSGGGLSDFLSRVLDLALLPLDKQLVSLGLDAAKAGLGVLPQTALTSVSAALKGLQDLARRLGL